MKNFLKIIEKDQLAETVNIAVCGAINSLSSLIGKSIYTCAPVFSTSIEEKINNSDSFDQIIISNLDEGASGNIIFSLSQNSASELTSLLSENIKSDILGEKMNKSALCEVGNILTGSCLSVVSKFTGVDLYQSIPYFVFSFHLPLWTIFSCFFVKVYPKC